MKTIEERIDQIVEGHAECRWLDASELRTYLEQIVAEQRAIDDAEIVRLKAAWEKEAEINHDAEMAYKQGRHDAIDKACEWLKNNLGYYDRHEVYIGKFYEDVVIEDFRKSMEE